MQTASYAHIIHSENSDVSISISGKRHFRFPCQRSRRGLQVSVRMSDSPARVNGPEAQMMHRNAGRRSTRHVWPIWATLELVWLKPRGYDTNATQQPGYKYRWDGRYFFLAVYFPTSMQQVQAKPNLLACGFFGVNKWNWSVKSYACFIHSNWRMLTLLESGPGAR